MKKKARKQIEKEGLKSLRLGMLDFLSHGKRILNTRWGSLWWIKKQIMGKVNRLIIRNKVIPQFFCDHCKEEITNPPRKFMFQYEMRYLCNKCLELLKSFFL